MTGIRTAILAAFAIGLRVGLADCIPTPGEEECERSLTDGLDNDCNGLVDAADPGCFSSSVRPGDCNGDGQLDVSDPICLLGHLFLGDTESLPCAGGTLDDEANIDLLDVNGDGGTDISDAIHALRFLFSGGPPPVQGTSCVFVPGCPHTCVPP